MKRSDNNNWKNHRSSSHSPPLKGDGVPVSRTKYTVAKKQSSKNSISEVTSSQLVFSSKYCRGESVSGQKDLHKADSFRHMLGECDTPSKYNLLKDALKRREGRDLLDCDKWRANSTEQFRHVSVSNLNEIGESTVYKEDKIEVKKQVTTGYKPSKKSKSPGFNRSCGNVLTIVAARNELYEENYSDSPSDSIQDCSDFPSKISIACEESFDVLKKRSRSLTDLQKCEIIEEDLYRDDKSKVSIALSNISEMNENQPIEFKYKPLQKLYNKESEPYLKYMSKKQLKVTDADYKVWLKNRKLIPNSDSESKSSECRSPQKEELYESLSPETRRSRSHRCCKQRLHQIELYTLEVDAFFNALNFFYIFARDHEWFKQVIYAIPILIALIIAFCSE